MDIVENFCGIPVPDWGEFRNFIHLKGKIFHGGTVRHRAGRPEVAPGGLRRDFPGPGQRDFPGTPGRRESRHQKRDSGFEQIRAEGRRAGTYAAPKAAGAAKAAADSCGELQRWDPPSTGSTDLGCMINISKAALCVDITFGNSFAESPSSRFKLPLATCKSEKQAAGWRLGECAPVISYSFD